MLLEIILLPTKFKIKIKFQICFSHKNVDNIARTSFSFNLFSDFYNNNTIELNSTV